MKHLVLFVILLMSGGLLTAQTSDTLAAAGLDAKIARLLELSGAEAQFLGAVDNMMAMQRQQVDSGAVPAEFWDEFSREIHAEGWQLILPELTAVYRNNMTEKRLITRSPTSTPRWGSKSCPSRARSCSKAWPPVSSGA